MAQPAAGAAPGQASPFTFGKLVLRPHLSYQYSYNDGVQAILGRPDDTEQHTYSPGMLVELGTRWRLDYTATVSRYSNADFRDDVAHAARFDGKILGRDWVMQTDHSYTSTSQTLLETGRQTAQQNVTSNLGFMHPFSPQLGYQGSVNQNLRFVEAFADSYEWGTTHGLNYRFSSRVEFGVGLMSGYVAMPRTADMVLIQPTGSLRWMPSEKTTFSFNGGVENRRLISGSRDEATNPILGSSFQYKPFEATTLSVGATRSTTSSFFAGQITHTRGWTATLQQRILKHLQVSIGKSAQEARYVAVSSLTDEEIRRTDDRDSWDAAVSMAFLRRGSVSLSYQRTRNTSSSEEFSILSRHYGVSVGFAY